MIKLPNFVVFSQLTLYKMLDLTHHIRKSIHSAIGYNVNIFDPILHVLRGRLRSRNTLMKCRCIQYKSAKSVLYSQREYTTYRKILERRLGTYYQ